MADSGNKTFKPNFSKELDIEAMISAPLVAASKANAVMVTGQTRFLLEYCFTKDQNDVYAPVMIVMSMTRGVVDEAADDGEPGQVKMVELNFSMPLLCIIPINSLAVDKVSIDFDMEITSTIPKKAVAANGTDNKVTDHRARLNGKIARSSQGGKGSDQRSNLKLSLNASPLPLPTGVLTILDLYTKAIQPVAVPPPASAPAPASASANRNPTISNKS